MNNTQNTPHTITLTLGEWTEIRNCLADASDLQASNGYESTSKKTWAMRKKIASMCPKYIVKIEG